MIERIEDVFLFSVRSSSLEVGMNGHSREQTAILRHGRRGKAARISMRGDEWC